MARLDVRQVGSPGTHVTNGPSSLPNSSTGARTRILSNSAPPAAMVCKRPLFPPAWYNKGRSKRCRSAPRSIMPWRVGAPTAAHLPVTIAWTSLGPGQRPGGAVEVHRLTRAARPASPRHRPGDPRRSHPDVALVKPWFALALLAPVGLHPSHRVALFVVIGVLANIVSDKGGLGRKNDDDSPGRWAYRSLRGDIVV